MWPHLLQGLYRHNQVEMRSLGWAPTRHDGILLRGGNMPYEGTGPRREEGYGEMEAEIGGILPSARELLGPPETGRGKEGPEGVWPCRQLDSQLLVSRTENKFLF